MWTDDWIGLGYRINGRGPRKYDCLGLFLALHKARFNRAIPDPSSNEESVVRPVLSPFFQSVQIAREGDAILCLAAGQLHIGFALNQNDMLHVHKDLVGACIEDFTSPRWARRLIGIYRYA